MEAINTLIHIRKLLTGAVSDLTDAQWLAIPAGFDNNIAWNIGHINVVQQSLIYRLSGLRGHTTKEQAKLFLPGTSPGNWSAAPDLDLLRQQTATLGNQLKQDFAAGQFTADTPYTSYTTSSGVHLTSFEQAVTFNNFHEGLHFGTILSIINFV